MHGDRLTSLSTDKSLDVNVDCKSLMAAFSHLLLPRHAGGFIRQHDWHSIGLHHGVVIGLRRGTQAPFPVYINTAIFNGIPPP